VKRTAILSLVLAALALGYFSLSHRGRERLAGLFSLDHEIRVEVATAHKRALGRALIARGEILPLKETRVNSPISGIIKEMRFAVGDRVASGAVVATIEAGDLAARLASQEAAIKDAEEQIKRSGSQLLAAERQLSATRDLFQKNFIPRREVEIAEAAAATARAEKEAAEAQLAHRMSVSAQTRQVLSLSRITAPVAGFVSRRWLEPGALVNESTPLLSISQMEKVKVLARVKSVDAADIGAGTPSQIVADALPEKSFRGKVTQIQEVANFSGDESSLEIEVPNSSNALKIGMTVTISMPLEEQREGIFVPLGAVVQSAPGLNHIFVIEGGKALRKEVVFGKQQGGEIEVLSGVQAGEAVVAKGVDRLRDGSRVLPVQ
jgi:membrane fusion protein, multidrug efflux system